jgi:YbbR domain-containing protein
VGKTSLKPSTIEIAGPREDLALINHVETIHDTFSGISMPMEGSIYLKSLGRLIEYSQDKVYQEIDIQEIGERIIVDIPVRVINKRETIRVFPSPQTVSLTVIGGVQRIAELNPDEIEVIIDFNDWNLQVQFYEPSVNVPIDILKWRDLSPRSLELGVAREVK